MGKPRRSLLIRLVEKYPLEQKERLLARILCGDVHVDGERVRDPRSTVEENADIRFLEKGFVSRGALKLLGALESWNIDVRGKVMLDAGASTGGFTDVLLRSGAAAVHAVDVGYNQLDFSLRKDPRVIVHERTNIMDIDLLDPVPDAAVADLSFRSVVKAAKHIIGLTCQGWGVILVKPQFELRDRVEGFTGIIEEKALLEKVLVEVVGRFASEQLRVIRVLPSPVKGRKGNQEFLFHIERCTRSFTEDSLSTIREEISSQVRETDLRE